MFLRCCIAAVGLLVGLFGTLAAATAGDWPQYRYDAQRTAASPEALPGDLQIVWTRELPPPAPAFPDEVRLAYDRSYEPVVLGDLMYVASMVTDSVAALDTETGDERWVFFAEGPIRFAPAAGDGKVYVASDDGYLYCLDAQSGELLWKFRGLPADREERKVLGNGRLISLHPARGGPVLDDGVVYFAAGLWPQDGVFVHALDAKTGEIVWSNTTSDQIEDANMDHGISQYAGLTPQGYLARVHDKLVVPCGAQLPALLNPETGELDPYTMGWGGRNGLPKGTWFVAGVGKYLSHGGDLYDITWPIKMPDTDDERALRAARVKSMMYPAMLTRLLIDPTNQRELGEFRRPVLTEEAMYYNDVEDGISAYDLSDVRVEDRSKFEPPKYRANDFYPDPWKGDVDRLWSLSQDADWDVHIKAGNRLYAGGKGTVAAIDIPASAGEPNVSWTASIDGTPHAMVAAAGKLFVTTREGTIYAFGEQAGAQVIAHKQPQPQATTGGDSAAAAGDVLRAAEASDGYAVVLGIDRGELVKAILAQSPMYVVAIGSDEARAQKLRKKLYDAGLYGTRATVVVGDPLTYPLPPFLANLLVSETPGQLGDVASEPIAASLFHPLRPYGGTACLVVGADRRDAVVEALKQADLPGAAVGRSGELVLLRREGELPEAASWTHGNADAANAVASQDRFVRAPLDILWFDGSLRFHRKPGSAEVRVVGGRVVVKTDELNATDAYTGRHMWRAELPEKMAGHGTQMVAVDDGVYLAAGRDPCLVFDPATGQQQGTIAIPDDIKEGEWSNLRVVDGYLVATIGPELVCLDRRSGELVWQFTCGRANLDVAVAGGKVLCAELFDRRREKSVEAAGTMLRAFELASGMPLWEVPCGEAVQYAEQADVVVTPSDVFDGRDGTRIRDGVADAQVAGGRLISGSADRLDVFDLASGDAEQDTLKWTRRGCTGLRSSCHLVTTRFKANAAYIDLETLDITPLWNIRPGCNNNLYPADGLLNVPNVTGGCECNYSPVSKALAPRATIARPRGARLAGR